MDIWSVDGNTIKVQSKEIYRYMGYRGEQPDESIAKRVTACMTQLAARSTPRSVWTNYPYEMSQDETSYRLTIGPLSFESRNLGRNLRGCSRIVMMAATIGPGVDFLIRRAEAANMVDAAIYQAAGAAMVESWCDMVNERIKSDMLAQGLYARPRFSPGYGDVPLAIQRDFSRFLNLSKNCGISLTDTLLMTPSKSVTAFIGFSPLEERCPLAGCEVCSKYETCNYHR